MNGDPKMHVQQQQHAPHAGTGAPSTRPASAQQSEPFSALCDAYMSAYEGRDRTRPTTLTFWRQQFGERPFATIDDDMVLEGLDALRGRDARSYAGKDAAGQPIMRSRGKLSPATVNRYHAALMALFTWAIHRRRAPKGWESPAHKIERPSERNQVVRFLTDAERERLLEACRQSSWPRLYALVLMAITTGARRGELLSLSWGRVDLERGIAHLEDTKNDHPRALPLVPVVVEELRRFHSERPEVLVFPSRSRLTAPRSFESSWLTALRDAKVKKFRFHDLRHTCASYLAQNGASLLEIADVMGHRQLSMVKRYAHLTTDTKAKLVNRVLGGIK
jgi:integrase